ncbi:hypothetical protein H8356DRAFT_1352254 [Neocallimastix lanati (nom. inval.)]|nr:hypothetical protein H8356DRAFT_1352254 [Neocallimastix sp. JGI-2020a]
MFKLHKHMWIYNKLIKELDQDMISHDNDGNYSLLLATDNDNIEIVKLLIDYAI